MELLTPRRKLKRARQAPEQWDTEIILERLDSLAHRALREPQFSSGLRKTQVAARGLEYAQCIERDLPRQHAVTSISQTNV